MDHGASSVSNADNREGKMTILELKLREVWSEFQKYAEKEMGYTNRQNLNESLNGAGAFVDFLNGRKPKSGTSYATHLPGKWPTD